MKKIIVIALTAILLLSGCNNKQPQITPTPQAAAPTATAIVTADPAAAVEATATAEPTAEPQPTVQTAATPNNSVFSLPMTIIDKNNIYIVLEDVINNEDETIELLFSMENDTGKDYTFSINAISINNIVMPFYSESKTVSAGREGMYSFIYSKYAIREYGIDDPADMQLYYSLYNAGENSPKYQDVIHLEGNKNFTAPNLGQGSTLIASNEYVSIYWARAYKDSYGDEYYEIIAQNKTDMALNLAMSAIAINGISVPSALNNILLPNSTLVHRGYVSGAESSFLTDTLAAAKAEAEFIGYNKTDNNNYFNLSSSYVFDEGTDLTREAYDGQIIYYMDNMTIGVKKIYDSSNACNQFELYILNEKETSAYITITDIVFNGRSIDSYYSIGVLPDTYASQIITPDDYIGDGQHEMSIKYEIRYSYTALPQQMGLSFVLQ